MKKSLNRKLFMLLAAVFAVVLLPTSSTVSFVAAESSANYADNYQPNVTVSSSVDSVNIITKPYDGFSAWDSGVAFGIEISTSISRLSNTSSMYISYVNSYFNNNTNTNEERVVERTLDESFIIPSYTAYYSNINFGAYARTQYLNDFIFTFTFSNLYPFNNSGTATNYMVYGPASTDYNYAYEHSSEIVSPFIVYMYDESLTNDLYTTTIKDFNINNMVYIDHVYKPLDRVYEWVYTLDDTGLNYRYMHYNAVYEIIYTNSDNVKLVFTIPIFNSNSANTLSVRQYITNYGNLTDSERYNIGYQDGYSNGVSTSQSNSYDNGLQQGYNNGYDVGYNKGYSVGVSENNTFGSLMFSVVDAPVQVFTSMLDFEVLGVNMSSFAISLLSIALLVAILRFIL